MDNLVYEKYKCVIESGELSLDALKRIVKHDLAHGWNVNADCKARMKLLEDCEKGLIKTKKVYDEKGDPLYGISWPLPLHFTDF